ncbi:MAG: hypothetical protein ACRC14_14135, partial [Paracoccaceae bacterium]
NIASQREREVAAEERKRGMAVADRIGVAALNDWYERNDAGYDHLRPAPTTLEEFFSLHGDYKGGDIALLAGREVAARDPQKYADVDLSDTGINADLTARRMAEDRDEAQILAMSPMPGMSVLIGGMAAAMQDPVNAALTVVSGGSGSMLRIMAREAAVNIAAEIPSIPAQFETAEELQKADPNVLQNLATAGVAGGLLGGALEGVARGIAYVGNRNRVTVPPEFDRAYVEASIQAAEDALAAGDNPLAAAMDIMRGAPPEAGMRAVEVGETPEPTALAPDPITTTVLPDRPPLIPTKPAQNITEIIPGAAPKARNARTSSTPKKPADIVSAIIGGGGILKSSDRGDLAALEYRRPGLLRVEAFRASSGGNNNGGRDIDMVREAMVEAGYLPEGATIDDLISAIGETARGRPVFAQADLNQAADWQAFQKSRGENPDRTAVEDFTDQVEAPSGLFISENELGFLGPDDVARAFDSWAADKPDAQVLTANERAEIIDILQTRGGDAEYLVERALEREADFVDGKQATTDIAAGNPLPEDAIGFGSPGPVTGETGGGGAGADGSAGNAGAANGQPPVQSLIPGTDRVQTGEAQRAKAEIEARKLQSRIGRLNQVRVEDDASSMFATVTGDMFDDITSPQATAYMDNVIAGLRADLEAGRDLSGTATAADGRALSGLAGLLDEIDDIDRMAAEYAACLTGKVTP